MRTNSLFLLLTLTLLASSCAKISAPVGGPKDVTPPSVTKEVPANGATNFSGNTIKISFNEYVTLNNTLENVLISPPPATQPTYTLSGKNLIIKFQDTLLPNQTYNLGFADCIQDFTEGNPIPFYNYAFSTGPAVDSMILKGQILDANTTQPVKDCFVFAYTEDIDSLPSTTRPQYISKTQANGRFQISNIKPGQYKVFALKDEDNNLLFSQPTEGIAFGATLFTAVTIPTDSVPTDSTTAKAHKSDKEQLPTLLFFHESLPQKILKTENKEEGKYVFLFEEDIEELHIRSLNDNNANYFQHIGHDTLTVFFKEKLTDTLQWEISCSGGIIDTVDVIPFKKETKNTGRRKTEKEERLGITMKNFGDIYTPLRINFSYPIRPTDSIEAKLISQKKHTNKDTLLIYISVPDTFATSISIPMKYEEKVPYQLIIPDSVFFGYNNLTNDTISASFTTKSEKDYGTLRMTYLIPNNGHTYIATLLSDKDIEIRSDRLTSSQELVYERLLEGKYKVQLLEDLNGNGKWDTGEYATKRQPERKQFFSTISIRGYWELEETFEWKEE